MRTLLGIAGWLLVGLAGLWLGLCIPAQLRSVSPLVLESAGAGTRTLVALARDFLDAGQIGPAQWAWQADPAAAPGEGERHRARLLLERFPVYRLSGGPAPYFEQFLATAPAPPAADASLAAALIPAANREHLVAFLEQSANLTVHAFLETRAATGYQVFLPVFSAAGQPLDAAILTLALLEQGGALPESLRRDLRRAASEGPLGDWEAACAAILVMSRHGQYKQVEALVARAASLEDLQRVAALSQREPARLYTLFAALHLADDPAALLDFLMRQRAAGWHGLRTALPHGAGAIAALVRFDRPIASRPAFWKYLPEFLRAGEPWFKGLAEKTPLSARALKFAALAVAGYCLAHLCTCLLRLRGGPDPLRRNLLRLDRAIAGALLAMFAWILLEPSLIRFEPNAGGTLRVNLAAAAPMPDLSSPATTETIMDQATLLVLVFFFVIQLMVFVIGLIKVREIARQDHASMHKLRLLDNEEMLFDLGLYIGLGGTVASLILIVLDVVQASLMAAYTSTLFGIIFVALLKIGFVRPARRKYILET
jgi:hypothetical protein